MYRTYGPVVVLVDPPRFIMPPLLLAFGALRFIIPLPLFVRVPEVLALEQPVVASASAASNIATTIMIRFWRIIAPFRPRVRTRQMPQAHVR
jgi:hypothetical protein